MYLFQDSFVRRLCVSRIKIPTLFANCNHSTNESFLVTSFNFVSFRAGTYWNISPTLTGVLMYICILINFFFFCFLISYKKKGKKVFKKCIQIPYMLIILYDDIFVDKFFTTITSFFSLFFCELSLLFCC